MVTDIVFWVLAALVVGGALSVVLMRDVFRAALCMVLCFFGVAAIFVTLNADFLAAAQVLVYVGAVAVLLIFAVMLTKGVKVGNTFGRLHVPALLASVIFLVTFVLVVVNTDWGALRATSQSVTVPVDQPTTERIATALFDKNVGFVLPFEIASLLLLAAVIGAIILAREKK